MVPILNRPIMEHIIGLVKHYGITEVIATLAFMPQVIADYFGDGEEWGIGIEYAIEETPLGTAGSVKNAERFIPSDEPLLVISGDALTDIDLSEVVRFHRDHGGAVTIALKSVPDPLDFGVVITAEDGLIERFLEKPTWGQVFSDHINTGIYVLEPWVLDLVPADTPFDFSADLFPLLMDAGHRLYGKVVDGYWCDVGSHESYVEAHRDVLDGLAKIHVPGIHAHEGLWVAETATIDPGAVVRDKVVLGNNAKIRAGAVVGEYTVVGDNCVIGADAQVDHTIIWSDSFVGKQSRVSGAVLCRHVDIRARAVVDSGAIIGSESVVGQGAHVHADVSVYPYKRIEPAATVNTSLIWESTAARSLFSDASISGLVGLDVTPELGLRVAEAFGTLLPKGAHVVVTRDGSRSARMIKRAVVAGLNASGIHVRDVRVASPAVSRFTTQKTRCVGGVHVGLSPTDPQALEIRFFDANGLDIPPWEQKKIERLYFRGEFRRAFFEDVGEIIYPPRPMEYYTSALDDAIAVVGVESGWRTVVADLGCGVASLVLPLVAHRWKLNLVALNPIIDSEAVTDCGPEGSSSMDQITRGLDVFGGDLGVSFDRPAERVTFITREGQALDGETALHLVTDLWCRTMSDVPGDIAVPLTASSAVERIAEEYGRTVIRPGRSRRALAQAVLDGRAVFAGGVQGGYIFGDFFPAYDGVLTVGMVIRMLAKCGMTMQQALDGLPDFHVEHESVFCPAARKGAVMRAVVEHAADMRSDLTEGVRVFYDDGWSLVLPDAVDPAVGVWAEGIDTVQAAHRVSYWSDVVKEAVSSG
jgi:mannose-1-phosphate guanylyltransferase/phosphomannomutase